MTCILRSSMTAFLLWGSVSTPGCARVDPSNDYQRVSECVQEVTEVEMMDVQDEVMIARKVEEMLHDGPSGKPCSFAF
mgnify:CR=1 FL=1